MLKKWCPAEITEPKLIYMIVDFVAADYALEAWIGFEGNANYEWWNELLNLGTIQEQLLGAPTMPRRRLRDLSTLEHS